MLPFNSLSPQQKCLSYKFPYRKHKLDNFFNLGLVFQFFRLIKYLAIWNFNNYQLFYTKIKNCHCMITLKLQGSSCLTALT